MARRGRPVLRGGRDTERHARRQDPEASARSRHGGLLRAAGRPERACGRCQDAHPQRPAAGAAIRVAPGSAKERRHTGPSQLDVRSHRDSSSADARPRCRGACRRRSIRWAMARRIRGNMDAPGHQGRDDRVSAHLHEGRLVYFGDVHAAQGDANCAARAETTAASRSSST